MEIEYNLDNFNGEKSRDYGLGTMDNKNNYSRNPYFNKMEENRISYSNWRKN